METQDFPAKIKAEFCKTCLMCLKTVNDSEECEVPDGSVKDMIEILFIEVHISPDSIICNTCMSNLNEAFNFKSTCIETEDMLADYVETGNTTKLDIGKILSNENQMMDVDDHNEIANKNLIPPSDTSGSQGSESQIDHGTQPSMNVESQINSTQNLNSPPSGNVSEPPAVGGSESSSQTQNDAQIPNGESEKKNNQLLNCTPSENETKLLNKSTQPVEDIQSQPDQIAQSSNRAASESNTDQLLLAAAESEIDTQPSNDLQSQNNPDTQPSIGAQSETQSDQPLSGMPFEYVPQLTDAESGNSTTLFPNEPEIDPLSCGTESQDNDEPSDKGQCQTKDFTQPSDGTESPKSHPLPKGHGTSSTSENVPKPNEQEPTASLNEKQNGIEQAFQSKYCRLCRNSPPSSDLSSFDEFLKDPNMMRLFEKHVPEMNLNIVNKPLVCKSCQETIKKMSLFMSAIQISEELLFQDHQLPKTSDIPVDRGIKREIKEEPPSKPKTKRHKIRKVHECEVCGFQTKNMYTHRRIHLDASQLKMYKCSLCCYEGKFDSGIRRHMKQHKMILEGTNPSRSMHYKCPSCSYSILDWKAFKVHIVTHPNLKIEDFIEHFKCFHCNYETNNKYRIQLHIKKHQLDGREGKRKCNLCNYRTRFNNHLRRHMSYHDKENRRSDGSSGYLTAQDSIPMYEKLG